MSMWSTFLSRLGIYIYNVSISLIYIETHISIFNILYILLILKYIYIIYKKSLKNIVKISVEYNFLYSTYSPYSPH